MPTVRTNSIDIAYDEYGHPDDPAMLMVMGLGLPSSAWPLELIEMLAAERFRVITFDNRDVGLSERFDHKGKPNLIVESLRRSFGLRVRAPYQLMDMMRDTSGVLDALDIESAHVVGVSMGGMISQLLAIYEPHRVRSLASIMSTTGNRRLPRPRRAVTRHVLRGPRSTQTEDRLEYFRRLLWLMGSPDYRPDPDDVEARLERIFSRGISPQSTARQATAILAAKSRVPELRKLNVPTIVIHGEEDPLVRVECGHDTAAAIRGAKIATIPGMGHDLPRELWPTLTELISGHAKSADDAASGNKAA